MCWFIIVRVQVSSLVKKTLKDNRYEISLREYNTITEKWFKRIKSLILAQFQRYLVVLYMQVERLLNDNGGVLASNSLEDTL